MKKKMFAAVVCVAMSMALCACNTTNPAGGKNPTQAPADVTLPATSTPGPTATPTEIEESYAELPITNYDDYAATTVLPEGYIGFEVDKITEKDVDIYVQEVLENNKDRVLKDGPLEMGDIAIIDYVGYLDGVAFEGGTDVSKELELGSGEFMEGFEEGLVGAKKGDTVSLNLKFPEDYWSEEMAGKEVVFEVKIHSSAALVLPEFTNEFVTEITSGEYTTVEEFRMYAKGFLAEERKYNSIMDYLVENAEFGKLNEDYISAAFDLEKQYYALMYGFNSVEEFETVFGEEASEVLWTMVEKQIRRYEQDRIVLYCVAKAENIELSETEYNEAVAEYAASNSMTLEELYEIQDEATLRQSMLMEKALEHLLMNIVEVEKGEE
ncbi:MAG: hypothetical protein E7268_07280 [Lachnospiraceae bacterium]|nr:hypothetical protein [Lachnospiraceae bacterium]